ncbi:hypothetical protein Rleg9DRAFT_1739 [Rhizobium leguminosarum bv. trifolii WSM597]|uniref:Uncharacterized protein n=1 Tax=Rhizobium leguminosarum bv. trifolii WSM597 TaxID=754764 RepID=I9N4V7_RHILT|nr:hypothetical protein Rleg9DRAFT_1739 [Rhizobium leguminosarum bv. trifolii WSM597]
MRYCTTVLLTVLMTTFLGLGFYGLFQHASKHLSGSHPTFHRVP